MKTEKRAFQSIRTRVIRFLLLMSIGMALLTYYILNNIMLHKIDLLEKQYTEQNVARAVNALQQEQQNLGDILTDWALWDDTYAFMADRNEKYIKTNMNYESFSNLNFMLMAFFDEQGSCLYAGAVNSQKKSLEVLSPDLIDYMKKSAFLSLTDETYRPRGIILLNNQPVLVAAASILPTTGVGTPRGRLVIGRAFDAEKVAALAKALELNMTLVHLPDLGPDEVKPFMAIHDDAPIAVAVSGENEIAGITVLKDIYGEPVLGLTIKMPRDIHTIGVTAVWATLILWIGLFLLFVIALLSVLDDSIFLRLQTLNEEIRQIGRDGKVALFSRRVQQQKVQDEFTTMSAEINAMLDQLEKSQLLAKENEAALQKANEILQIEIGERKKAQDDIKYIAYHDYLTGLPNRILCRKLLNNAIDDAKYLRTILAVLFLDIDGFKGVNDTMGHLVGDSLLQEVANRLVNTLRKTDVVVRFGGDEFIVLIEKINGVQDIELIANKIVRCFQDPFKLEEQECFVTTSIGIAVYPEDGDTASALIKNADAAMYTAKAGGKNQHAFWQPPLEKKK